MNKIQALAENLGLVVLLYAEPLASM